MFQGFFSLQQDEIILEIYMFIKKEKENKTHHWGFELFELSVAQRALVQNKKGKKQNAELQFTHRDDPYLHN